MIMATKKAKKKAAKANKSKKASPKKSKTKKIVKKTSIERNIEPIVKKETRPRPQKPKVLKECKAELAFVLNDGRQLKSLVHLIDELENMPDEVFNHHVNEFKNDFSSWIRDVFKDDILADELQLVNDRLETQRTLLKHTVRSFLKK